MADREPRYSDLGRGFRNESRFVVYEEFGIGSGSASWRKFKT